MENQGRNKNQEPRDKERGRRGYKNRVEKRDKREIELGESEIRERMTIGNE